MENFLIVLKHSDLLIHGLGKTLILLLVPLLLGLTFAIPLSAAIISQNRLIRWPIWLYTYCFRGTPLLVQIFVIYYGLGQFEAIRNSPLWQLKLGGGGLTIPLLSDAWPCLLLALTLNTCAYTIEILSGAIRNIPAGEIEAARSLGFSDFKLFTRILLPSALRRSIPAYSNEVIFMLHATALASVVTVMDLTGAARDISASYYFPYEPYVVAATGYLALTFILVSLFKFAEKRWLAFLQRR